MINSRILNVSLLEIVKNSDYLIWSEGRRLRREKHERKTPQTSLLVEEAEAMPAESVRP